MNMMTSFYQLVFIYTIFPMCSGASSIQYDAIFALVVIELVFAFGVGLSCILFSINLIRAINDPSPFHVPIGTFPKSRASSCSNAYLGDIADGDDAQIASPEYSNLSNYEAKIPIQNTDPLPTYDTFYHIPGNNIPSVSPSEASVPTSANSHRQGSSQLSPPKSILSAFFEYMW